jgi:hypothetical protein
VQLVELESFDANEVAELFTWMATNVVPFAHSLALAQGLTARQSADRFRRTAYPVEPTTYQDKAAFVEGVARFEARFYRAIHGHADLYRDGDSWLVESSLEKVRPEIEKWGVSLGFYVDWADGIDRHIAKRDDISMETWLEGHTLKLRVRESNNG